MILKRIENKINIEGLTPVCRMSFTRSPGTSMMFTSCIRAQLTPGYMLPKLNGEQISVLEENFKQTRNPNDFEISLISAEAGVYEADVKLWYQHRLAVWRQRQGLPANSGYVHD